MLSRHRTYKIVGALFALMLVVSTLQAQEPTPTPAPSPVCEPCIQQQIDETITLRRLVILFGGMWMGWQACVLIYKWV